MQKLNAIILSSRDVNEFDRLYFLYTKETGLIRVIGKGVRKPAAKLAGHLEPGTLSEIYVAKSRGMGQITSAITLDSFKSVKKDFQKLAEALKIFRFFLKNFSEGEKDERIFGLLCGFLEILDKADLASKAEFADKADLADVLVEAFWWKLFDALGQRPEVVKCVSCGEKLRGQSQADEPKLGFSLPASKSPEFIKAKLFNSSRSNLKKFFSVEKGGAVCAACVLNFENVVPISDNQIKLLKIFWGNSLKKIAKVKIGERELGRLGKIRKNFEKYNF